uniref:ATP synthase F0 subunit 8 n=1 Tax=Mastigeulota kiangsinensis TaxID=1544384 RepID=A0A0U1XAK1_MASKI|nr:ATP synthase F0 subunit 8 [Mastigeulota kiangsinensis]AIN75495.1 ATP synthase F0 subunit 8 [Mastigeulota kiangsinensis]
MPQLSPHSLLWLVFILFIFMTVLILTQEPSLKKPNMHMVKTKTMTKPTFMYL